MSSRNPRLNIRPRMTPVPETDAIYSVWPKILKTILQRVKLPGLSAIACVRYGESARTTVIFIGDSEEATQNHINKTRKGLRAYLDQKNLSHVDIAFIRGRTLRGSSTTGELDTKIFDNISMMGQSLANKANTVTCGTLGGFFEVRLQGSSKWKTVAMTCCHVVMPEMEADEKFLLDYWSANNIFPKGQMSPKQMLAHWRDNGIRPDDPNRKMLQVCHPAEATMKKHWEEITRELNVFSENPAYQATAREYAAGLGEFRGKAQKAWYRQLKNEEDMYKEKEAACQSFVDNIGIDFGTVWAASGFRQGSAPASSAAGTHLQHELDWALIEVLDHRIPRFFETPDGKSLSTLPPPPPGLFAEPYVKVPVYFFGQRTGKRGKGICHGLKCAVVLERANFPDPGVEPSFELIATGTGETGQFSLSGDSGSVALTGDWNNPVVLGLVWAGQAAAHYTMFTHIDHVYSDIKKLTGAKEFRIKM